MTKMKNLDLMTELGRKRLGQIMRLSREQRGWSMEYIVDQVSHVLGHKMGRSTVSNLERGYHEPTWYTLQLLANLEYIYWPGTTVPMSAIEMILIACEIINPEELVKAEIEERIKNEFFVFGKHGQIAC